jgi:hypothetical protein
MAIRTSEITSLYKITDNPPFIETRANPISNLPITTYVPPRPLSFTSSSDSGLPYILNNCYEPALAITGPLSPQDLANLSEVSKDCYVATKISEIWRRQLAKLLPNVTPLPNSFSREDQFKIIFKFIFDWNKPYLLALRCNNQLLNQLRDNNGFTGEINKAWARNDFERWDKLISLFTRLAGGRYNDARASITPESINARLIDFIEKTRQEYNNQNNFDELIQEADAARAGQLLPTNTASNNILSPQARFLEALKDAPYVFQDEICLFLVIVSASLVWLKFSDQSSTQ